MARPKTCDTCKFFQAEHYMDGPGTCEKSRNIVWPTDKCAKYVLCDKRGYYRTN